MVNLTPEDNEKFITVVSSRLFVTSVQLFFGFNRKKKVLIWRPESGYDQKLGIKC